MASRRWEGRYGIAGAQKRGTGGTRAFSKLDTDAQTILLLAFREHQAQRGIAQIAHCSERVAGYKIPAALAQLARLLDRASML
jgi:DNA-directed RNA polymerase specialized sigma24 family protein